MNSSNNLVLKVNSKVELTEYIPFDFNISSYNIISFNVNPIKKLKVIMVLEGKIELETQGRIIVLEKNQIGVINPSKVYIIKPQEKNLIIELNIDRSFLVGDKDNLEIMDYCIFGDTSEEHYKKLVELIENLFYLYVKDNVVSSNMLLTVLNEVLNVMNGSFVQSREYLGQAFKFWQEEKLYELMERIYKNSGRYLLNDLADEFGMKPSNFSNLFKKVSGCGFVDFHHYTRLEKIGRAHV